ncbi:butyrophilin subfamily 2 member A1-like [Epinephelus lanceolatus]
MKLQLDLLCFCLLCFTGKTLCDEKGPAAIKVLVSEGSDVTLPCSLSTKENIEQNLFVWRKDDGMMGVFMYSKGLHYNNGRSGQDEQFKGRVFHFQDELKYSNASIIIRNTKMADSGDYTCFFPFVQRREKSHVMLVVVSSPKPSVTVLKTKLDWVQLQCVVRGASLKPKVEWKDSDGNILPAEEPQVTDKGGSYDIIFQTSVTKTDRYHCVVTQEEINHQIHAEIPVHIIDETWSNGNIACLVAGAILVLLWGCCSLIFLCHHRCRGSEGSKTAEREEEQQPLNTGAHDSQAAAPPDSMKSQEHLEGNF